MSAEAGQEFPCFGGIASVRVGGAGDDGASAEQAVARVRGRLEDVHRRLSRFDPASELSLLNADPREVVPASPLLRRLARAAVEAGRLSGGLVDATMVSEIERAGYRDSRRGQAPLPLNATLAEPIRRQPAAAAAAPGWERIAVDDELGTISRPPGLRIDSGGLAKGLAADLVAVSLRRHPRFAVDCCGDIRIGGSEGSARRVEVADPFGREPARAMALSRGAVATSGITARSWSGPGGAHAHHLLDPSTGAPAFTGVVQATAVAPTALLAEIYAKSALLAGPAQAPRWLSNGGVVIAEDGRVDVVAARAAATERAA